MAPTPYFELNDVLQSLVEMAQEALGTDLIGVYLQGSFAIGDADEHSDVDFLAVVREPLSPSQIEALQEGHARLHDGPSEWARHLEGSYFPAGWLRQSQTTGRLLPYLDNGSRTLERSDHDDTLVLRWTVRERGIALWGPPARTLIDPVSEEALRAEVRAKLASWAEEAREETPSWILNAWGQPYAVLSFCRMRHTLATGRIESKRAGALWAREALDPRWRDLIDAALADRPDPWTRVRRPADPERAARTAAFMRAASDDLLHGRI